MAGAVNTIGQSKRGGGDRSSRSAQLQARENEQKALSLWIKGATFQQIAAAGFGIASASGAWRSVGRALAQIPKQEADQAREAQRARLQAPMLTALAIHRPSRLVSPRSPPAMRAYAKGRSLPILPRLV